MTEESDAGDEDPPTDGEGEESPGEAEGVADDGAARAADGGTDDENGNGNGDETVPHVELGLYELSVRVSGQSDDELEDVEESATRLMEFLIDQAKQLEDQPDTRGLS